MEYVNKELVIDLIYETCKRLKDEIGSCENDVTKKNKIKGAQMIADSLSDKIYDLPFITLEVEENGKP